MSRMWPESHKFGMDAFQYLEDLLIYLHIIIISLKLDHFIVLNNKVVCWFCMLVLVKLVFRLTICLTTLDYKHWLTRDEGHFFLCTGGGGKLSDRIKIGPTLAWKKKTVSESHPVILFLFFFFFLDTGLNGREAKKEGLVRDCGR